MQQYKNTEKTRELQHFIEDDSKTGYCLEESLKFFDVRQIFNQFDMVKQRGIQVSVIMTALLVMLFYKSRNIHSYFSKCFGLQHGIEGSKNPYYDLLGNEFVCWRTILILFAKRFIKLSSEIMEPGSNKIRALIFDDSPIAKSGKKIEFVSKVHDHVTGGYIFGYKLLVCGYWDGDCFIPVDFSFHRERGTELDKLRKKCNKARRKAKQTKFDYEVHKNSHQEKRCRLNELRAKVSMSNKKVVQNELKLQEKRVLRSKQKLSLLRKKMKEALSELEQFEQAVREKERKAPTYGLTASQKRKQFRKKRQEDSPGHQRAQEVDMGKVQSLIGMLSRAVKKGFIFDYVLFDSWFFSKEVLAKIESYRTKCIKLVAMVKMGKQQYSDCLTGKAYTAEELRKLNRKKVKRNRRFNAQYIFVPVYCGNYRVNLFFVKLGASDKWKVLLTNDLKLSFVKLMEVYQIRWSIEVFFKDAKQYLQLGKCQCNNFDSQVGATTIAMLQYIMLLLYKKRHYQYSIGSIFDMLSSQAQDENISRYLAELFWEIVTKIGTVLNIDCFEVFEQIMREDDKANEILRLFLPILDNKAAA